MQEYEQNQSPSQEWAFSNQLSQEAGNEFLYVGEISQSEFLKPCSPNRSSNQEKELSFEIDSNGPSFSELHELDLMGIGQNIIYPYFDSNNRPVTLTPTPPNQIENTMQSQEVQLRIIESTENNTNDNNANNGQGQEEMDVNMNEQLPTDIYDIQINELLQFQPSSGSGSLGGDSISADTPNYGPDCDLIPTFEKWQGRYHFNVMLNDDSLNSKKIVYLFENNQIYCTPNLPVTFKIFLDREAPIKELRIASMLYFQDAKFVKESVVRCSSHEEVDKNHKDETVQSKRKHVLQSTHKTAKHCMDEESKRCWVQDKVLAPDAGAIHFKRSYIFKCLNSCKSPIITQAINRRALNLVFTLHHGTNLAGRCVFGLKICSCPKRDCEKDRKEITGENKKKGRVIVKKEIDEEINITVPSPCESPKKETSDSASEKKEEEVSHHDKYWKDQAKKLEKTKNNKDCLNKIQSQDNKVTKRKGKKRETLLRFLKNTDKKNTKSNENSEEILTCPNGFDNEENGTPNAFDTVYHLYQMMSYNKTKNDNLRTLIYGLQTHVKVQRELFKVFLNTKKLNKKAANEKESQSQMTLTSQEMDFEEKC